MLHDAAMALLHGEMGCGKVTGCFFVWGWVYSSMRKRSSFHLLLKYEVEKGTRLPVITHPSPETAIYTMAQQKPHTR